MLFAPKEKGQGLVEYALILVLVAIVVIAVLMLLGPIIGNVFSTINASLSGVSLTRIQPSKKALSSGRAFFFTKTIGVDVPNKNVWKISCKSNTNCL